MAKFITLGNLATFKTKYDTIIENKHTEAMNAANAANTAATEAKSTANAKYSKPSGGIPKSDLASGVQTSLGKADTALQSHQTIATGSTNGTISVGGKDVAVKGLGTLAYKASVSKSDVGLGNVENCTMDRVPTNNSDNYVTSGGVKDYVDSSIGAVKNFQYEVVTELPTAAAATMGKIYLVKHVHSTGDSYDEYITIQSDTTYSWEKIGNTDIDLSGYFNTLNWSVYNGDYPDSIRGVVIDVSQEGSKLIVHEKSLYSSEFDVTDLSGSDVNFISNISQDRIGKITAKYKQVRVASQTQSGLMSTADKTKLDGITEATTAEIEALFA